MPAAAPAAAAACASFSAAAARSAAEGGFQAGAGMYFGPEFPAALGFGRWFTTSSSLDVVFLLLERLDPASPATPTAVPGLRRAVRLKAGLGAAFGSFAVASSKSIFSVVR